MPTDTAKKPMSPNAVKKSNVSRSKHSACRRMGVKWKQSARSRSGLLLRLSVKANPDGTFIGPHGENFSPSFERLSRARFAGFISGPHQRFARFGFAVVRLVKITTHVGCTRFTCRNTLKIHPNSSEDSDGKPMVAHQIQYQDHAGITTKIGR